jgi:quercetin dioxygenase-like cupin family protein
MRLNQVTFAVLTSVAVAASALVLSLSGTAIATPQSPGWVTEMPLTQAFFESIRIRSGDDDRGGNLVRLTATDPSDVYVAKNTIAPGADSGWHSHPGPSLVIVKSGTVTVYESSDPSCTGVTYGAGSGFIDAGGTHTHLVRNESTTQTSVTVAFQIIPHGLARRIDEPKPSQCP